MKFASVTTLSATLVGTMMSSLTLADDNSEYSPYHTELPVGIVAHPFYAADYLASLSAEDREAALRPQQVVGPLGFDWEKIGGSGVFNNGFVHNDPRRTWSMDDTLTLGVTTKRYEREEELSRADQDHWFRESIDTWFTDLWCTGKQNPFQEVEWVDQKGVVETVFTENGRFDESLIQADITQMGFFRDS